MHHDPVLARNLRWLIRLRWTAIGLSLAGSFAARRLGYLAASPAPLYGILLFLALCNLLFTLQERRGRADRRLGILAQIGADQLTLAALFAASGACHSPLLFFFLFHVVIGGILLPHRYTILVAAGAALLPLAVIAMSHAGLLPFSDILGHAASRSSDPETIITHGVAFLVTLFLTTYFAVYLSRELQRSSERLADENRKLAALVDSSRLAAPLSERSELAARSFRAILKDSRADARIVLLDRAPAGARCSVFFGCRQPNCPAFRTDAACWKLTGTRCASHAAAPRPPADGRTPGGTAVAACFTCGFFVRTAGTLLGGRGGDVRLALLNGLDMLHGGAAFPPVAQAAFPLVMHDRLSGLLLLSSSDAAISGGLAGFITLFAELTASGLVGSSMIDDLEASYLQTVEALANAIEAKDPYTRGHSRRVAHYSLGIASALGLTRQEKEHLSFAAVLHDVGKIGVSRKLLVKEGRLTEPEQEAMRSHPEVGARILEPVRFLRHAIPAIQHHHEQVDGSGYPAGLQGDDIPFMARIVNVADAWDAMTTDRAYRTALPRETALAELLRCAGAQFDREIVGAFMRSIGAAGSGDQHDRIEPGELHQAGAGSTG